MPHSVRPPTKGKLEYNNYRDVVDGLRKEKNELPEINQKPPKFVQGNADKIDPIAYAR